MNSLTKAALYCRTFLTRPQPATWQPEEAPMHLCMQHISSRVLAHWEPRLSEVHALPAASSGGSAETRMPCSKQQTVKPPFSSLDAGANEAEMLSATTQHRARCCPASPGHHCATSKSNNTAVPFTIEHTASIRTSGTLRQGNSKGPSFGKPHIPHLDQQHVRRVALRHQHHRVHAAPRALLLVPVQVISRLQDLLRCLQSSVCDPKHAHAHRML